MLIGEAAQGSGVSAKLIRYYESTGLLSASHRHSNGYRLYEERHVHELRFIKRARSLGFPIREIRSLLDLWRNKRRASSKVRAIAMRHRSVLEERARSYQGIIDVLDHLIAACKGDDRPDCPILEDLSRPSARSSRRPPRIGGSGPSAKGS
ncbi:MAG: Cu(I)-responsive transcriptional regulator [Hyphomicrobiaceae bacterium]|nr:Cu(I)-responsive transcriptional regulator [Hyphomicrobiaceae bacterium]